MYWEGIVTEVTDRHVLGWKDLRGRGQTDIRSESFCDKWNCDGWTCFGTVVGMIFFDVDGKSRNTNALNPFGFCNLKQQ